MSVASMSLVLLRLADVRFASSRLASVRLACAKLAPFRLARARMAPLRLAVTRPAPLRLAYARLTPLRLEDAKLASLRCSPQSHWSDRFARNKSKGRCKGPKLIINPPARMAAIKLRTALRGHDNLQSGTIRCMATTAPATLRRAVPQ